MKTVTIHTGARGLATRLALGVHRLRDRVTEGVYRGQLGPSREAEWREFSPRH
jgi:hypothetical protein